jgi:regulator of nucleoside diphosphate kinase
MTMPIYGERKLTRVDFARLRRLHAAGMADGLEDLLAEAEVVDPKDMPADVVTMYAQFEIEESTTRRRQTLVICYPGDAEPSAGYISVLSPVGLALIGLQAGDVARWQAPSGESHSAELLAVKFQPEATGDYVT